MEFIYKTYKTAERFLSDIGLFSHCSGGVFGCGVVLFVDWVVLALFGLFSAFLFLGGIILLFEAESLLNAKFEKNNRARVVRPVSCGRECPGIVGGQIAFCPMVVVT